MASQVILVRLDTSEVKEAITDFLEKKYGETMGAQANGFYAKGFSDERIEIDSIEVELEEEDLIEEPEEDLNAMGVPKKTGKKKHQADPYAGIGFSREQNDDTMDLLAGLGDGKATPRAK